MNLHNVYLDYLEKNYSKNQEYLYLRDWKGMPYNEKFNYLLSVDQEHVKHILTGIIKTDIPSLIGERVKTGEVKPDMYELPASQWVRSAKWLNVFIVFFSFVVAVFGSIKLNYVGKAWGNCVDYLTMILTAGGVDLAAIGLLAGINRVFYRFRSSL
jgi:hypothetical protein